ncbi:MAG TPA: hypothetical protein VFE77_03075 [Rhodanobacter sp.]|nr:hypothetical protein [Rhodanobacter sp.]
MKTLPRTTWDVPPEGRVFRYIFTCAQNNTKLFTPAWENIKALAKHYNASIHVSTFTYNKAAYGKGSIKRGSTQGAGGEPWWAPELEPHILDQSVQVAPGLVWCGEMNILPTAVQPLSGLEAYTGRQSGIIPHVQFAMRSVASQKSEGTKINYTTGTVTQRNYILKKEGLKASFHHGYGGLLVEVDSDGVWFVRQLNADSEGTIYDLTLRAKDGKVTKGHRMEGITWGDIHLGTVPAAVDEMLWGKDGMMDVLKPRFQFMHDVLDFRSRNHHDRGNPHANFEKYINNTDSVAVELQSVARFLTEGSYRPWCKTVIVDSNHDNALKRWLREADYRTDPPNALLFLKLQLAVYQEIAAPKLRNFNIVDYACRLFMSPHPVPLQFLKQDESFVICGDANGGIECGIHGHNGSNGRPGSAMQFAQMGRKTNTGHSHSAGIWFGAYVSGITGDLEQGYNVGQSSWTRSHIGVYPNGKRVIITCYGKGKHPPKWRA